MIIAALSSALSLLLCVEAAQAQPKRVYIALDDHTDFFWSADEETYRNVFLESLDYYLDLADATDGNPPEFQSRWNCDGSFWMWTYERHRSPEKFKRLIDRIGDGHISVPLNALCVCLGGAPTEAVLRGMYYPGRIERRYGLRFPLAYMIENQTQPLGLTALWAGSGAKYSWKGICGCDSKVPDAWDREHDIYRAVGPDGSEVIMKWNSMLFGNQNMGGYAEARNPSTTIDTVTTNAASNGFLERYPFHVIGCFGKGWDDVQTLTDQFVSIAMEKTDRTRQIIVSNEQDFFEDFAATFDVSALPAVSVSFGNEWELYGASLAEVSSRVKRAVEKLRCAEALAAVVTLVDDHFMAGRAPARDLAFMNLGLFWEHDFGMVDPPTGPGGVTKRIAWQRRITEEIEHYVDRLHADAVASLGDLVTHPGLDDVPSSGRRRFFVFNPLSWTRTDVADLPYAAATPVHVVDLASDTEVPSQSVTIGGQIVLRILARDLPPVGYRVYEIRRGKGHAFADAATVRGNVVEDARYRAMFADRGAITSLIDKRMGDKEFVQPIGGRAINDLGPSSGTFSVEHLGPVSACVKMTGPSPVAHTTYVTFYREIDRIDVRNEITQNFGGTETWSFGFALENPEVRHEEVGAILRARLAPDGGDYSDRNARYDWLTLNHFADMTGTGEVGVTLSNADCYFMKLGDSGRSVLDTQTPQINVLAGGRVANGGNGLPNQGGDDFFLQRFALRTHGPYDQTAAMKFALEHQDPPVAGAVTGCRPVLPARLFSAVSTTDRDILLWALKPAEEGRAGGWIARFWNMAETPRSTRIQLPPAPIVSARRTSHIETDGAAIPVGSDGIRARFARQQIRTFRLVPSRIPHRASGPSDDGPRPNTPVRERARAENQRKR